MTPAARRPGLNGELRHDVAALLAAGAGSRFAGPGHKLTALLHGTPVWHHALLAVVGAGFERVVVVSGSVDLGSLPDLPGGSSPVEIIHHRHWSDGQATSLGVAANRAAELGAGTLTVGLADQPFLGREAWAMVRATDPACRLVVAEYDGRRGPHPVRIDASLFAELPREGDDGARHLVNAHPEWVCTVQCVGSATDIDTLEDLHRWNSC